MKIFILILISILMFCSVVDAQNIHLEKLKSPVLFQGDEHTAYRDPAVLYHEGMFYLFFYFG